MKDKVKFGLSIIPFKKYNTKVKIADIKQYLVDEFKLAKDLDKQNKEYYKEIERLKEIVIKYEVALVTLDEYKDRLQTKYKDIKELKETIKLLNKKIKQVNNEKNDAILEKKKADKYISQVKKNVLKDIKKELIILINNQKGTLSKKKAIEIINEAKYD